MKLFWVTIINSYTSCHYVSAAIVAMRRAHKQELERSRQSQQIKESADITQLYVEHE